MDCHVADAPRNDGYLTRHCGLAVIAAWLSLRLGRHCGLAVIAAWLSLRPGCHCGLAVIAAWLSLRAKRGNPGLPDFMDCHVADAPRNDGYSSQ
jgi:hypothetical protein